MNARTVMTQYRTHFTGQWVAQCPQCGTVCPCWDSEDLNDAGELECSRCTDDGENA